MANDVFEFIIKWIDVEYGIPKSGVRKEMSFEDLDLDAIDVIELAMEIEEEYDISIDDDIINAETTIDELCKMVEKLL